MIFPSIAENPESIILTLSVFTKMLFFIQCYDLAPRNMSLEIKQLLKVSSLRQVELRLISNYRNFRKLLHIFAVSVAEINCILHIILFISKLLNPSWHR